MKQDSHHRLMRVTIKRLARRVGHSLAKGSAAFKEARLRSVKPMDYLRCGEFPLAHRHLSLSPGMRVLDVASPQWFSLALAFRHPDVRFTYINILDWELDQIRDTAGKLGLSNITYSLGDCRRLDFPSASFERVVSLSTIEHIAPEKGGDVQALKEIRRVMTDGGEFVLSVPFKEKASVLYDDVHEVWEKPAQKDNFYMRNYDRAQLEALAADSGFRISELTPMYEKPGLFAMEYWENAGRLDPRKNAVMKLKKKLDKLTGLRLEHFLSLRHIRFDSENRPGDRLMNVVATLVKD